MYILTLFLGIVLFRTLLYLSVFSSLKKKYSQWCDLNKLVATKYASRWDIFRVSAGMVLEMWWIDFLQFLNGSIQEFPSKNKAIITYTLHEKKYRFPVHIEKGPNDIEEILDQDGVEIAKDILPFYGPGKDWHGLSLTPEFFGKKSLTFLFLDGNSKTFSEKQFINTQN